MRELTERYVETFQKIVMRIQKEASLQEIHKIDEFAIEMRTFVRFA